MQERDDLPSASTRDKEPSAAAASRQQVIVVTTLERHADSNAIFTRLAHDLAGRGVHVLCVKFGDRHPFDIEGPAVSDEAGAEPLGQAELTRLSYFVPAMERTRLSYFVPAKALARLSYFVPTIRYRRRKLAPLGTGSEFPPAMRGPRSAYRENQEVDDVVQLREAWFAHFETVMIDAPPLRSRAGTLAAVQLADIIVPVFTMKTDLGKLRQALSNIQRIRQKSILDLRSVLTVPIAIRVPEGKDRVHWFSEIERELGELYHDWLPRGTATAAAVDSLSIPDFLGDDDSQKSVRTFARIGQVLAPILSLGPRAGSAWRERFLGGSPDRERELFTGFSRDIQRLQDATERRSKSGSVLRGFHAKPVLGVRGKLRLRTDLPPKLCVEGYLEPGLELPVVIRYSMSSHDVKPDAKRNGRGIALRIQYPAGAQDLLFSDSPVSHARDARQFMTFVKVLSAPLPYKPLPLIQELGLRESVRLLQGVLKQTFSIKPSLAVTRFWGKTPMRINEQAVKYQLMPRGAGRGAGAGGPNFMRDDLIQCLDERDVEYDLCIQRFVDEVRTPLEDHSVEWYEQDAPRETIGALVIERGAFQAQPAELEAEIERMAFNPWNTADALRPLGSLNRARKFVYAASADHRQRPPPRGRLAHLQQRTAGPLAWLAERTFEQINRIKPWWELHPWLGTANLYVIRRAMRERNLYDTGDMLATLAPNEDPGRPCRQPDGRGNDLQFPEMGSARQPFGRNFPRHATRPESGLVVLTPNPRQVSRELLARQGAFLPAGRLNLLAAAWIQFQVHDWFAHSPRSGRAILVPIKPDDPWPGERPMPIRITPRAAKTELEREYQLPPAYENQASHWWDGSQLYGADDERAALLRDGARLRLDKAGLLPLGADGLPLTGANDNWWLGLELLHTLFAREHNALCDMLEAAYPSWPAQRIFDAARLINAALMAKIHTIEWTPTILGHPALKLSMDLQWWGLLGQRFYRAFGRVSESELISGIPGSRREHFEVPFSLTEEFVSVYRLHALLPDTVALRRGARDEPVEVPFPALAFKHARRVLLEHGLHQLMYSFGRAHPGALRLNNYPHFLLNLESPDEPLRDVGAIDIFRDRERGVPRYNRFRELLGLSRMTSYEELTGGDAEAAQKLRKLYGDDGLDRVDLLIGCLAEKPPPGFGFGDTAFRVFVLMASRRLKSDRFFTDDFNEATYTREGLAWVRDNTMISVLLRHFPDLQPALRGLSSAFAPWGTLG